MIGCRSSAPADPSAIFEQIHSDFLRGNLDSAQQEAEKAREYFSGRSANWSMKFRILEAEILTYQGRRPDVLDLLNKQDISYPSGGDLAIKRDLLCSLAHARLGQSQQADIELNRAARLSDASRSQLRGEVLRTQAQVQVYRDHLPEAIELFKRSLKAAREERDTFLEATDLLNLGLAALKLSHYDESLSLFNEAAGLGGLIQARSVIQAALGNAATAYFALGDYEKALLSFQQAEHAARAIGTTSAQIDWLWSAGSAYSQLGNLDQAATCYRESLKDALAIHSVEEIAGIQTDLAFLLYKQGLFADAKIHSDEAIEAARNSGDEQGEQSPLFLQALLVSQQKNSQDAEQMLLRLYERSSENLRLREQIEKRIGEFLCQ